MRTTFRVSGNLLIGAAIIIVCMTGTRPSPVGAAPAKALIGTWSHTATGAAIPGTVTRVMNFQSIFPDGQRGMWELDAESAPELYREAVSAAIYELIKTNENPKDFFVQFPSKPADEPVIILNLWHKSAFDKNNYGREGNPGGKCRDMHYDKLRHKIIKVLFWQ